MNKKENLKLQLENGTATASDYFACLCELHEQNNLLDYKTRLYIATTYDFITATRDFCTHLLNMSKCASEFITRIYDISTDITELSKRNFINDSEYWAVMGTLSGVSFGISNDRWAL